MKAILMTQPGVPEVLQLQDVADPTLSSGSDILVRLKAAGVNPIDTKLRSRGTFYPDNLPTILGCDGAGIVEAVGEQVTRYKPGDEVYFCNGGIGGHPGNYAELAVVDEAFAAHKPTNISFAEAAAAPLALITAWESLFDRANLETDESVLIHAGAGGVGHVAIQLAKAAGARVITTISDDAKAGFVTELGADATVNYKQCNFADAVNTWTDGTGVDVAFDTVGGKVLSQTFEAVRYYGDVVTLLQPDADTNWSTARLRNQSICLELMLTPMHKQIYEAQIHQAEILKECAQLFEDGRLKIHISHALRLADAAEAHRLIEAGGMMGKVVLMID